MARWEKKTVDIQRKIISKGAEVKSLHEFFGPLLYGHKAVYRAYRFIKLTYGIRRYYT